MELSALEKKKRFLKRYKRNNACIDRLKNKLLVLTERIESVKSPNMSGMPRGSVPVGVEDLLSDKMDLEKRIAKLKAKKSSLKEKVLEEIDNLEDTRYIDVLEMFFIDCMSFEEIAEVKDYTERHVIRLYTDAIKWLVDNDTMTD